MTIHVIKPEDPWQPGDRAYCVRGSQNTKPTLEAGKTYVVASVIPMKGCVDDGLVLQGVALPEGSRGIWSSRFLKLSARPSALRQIAAFTTPSWLAAYRASTSQAPRPVIAAKPSHLPAT